MARIIEFPHPQLTGSYVYGEEPRCALFGMAPVVPIKAPEPHWRSIVEVVKSWGITIEEIAGGPA